MTIPLDKHVKIWVHPDGLIPKKVHERLLFQRELRPDDTLTLFLNKECLENNTNDLRALEEAGIKLVDIENALSESEDDKYLKQFIKNILAKVRDREDVTDSVFLSDILRVMEVVQNTGLYSDTDVLFLPGIPEKLLTQPYLFGTHKGGMTDTHIFGVHSYKRQTCSESLIKVLHMLYDELDADAEYIVSTDPPEVPSFTPSIGLLKLTNANEYIKPENAHSKHSALADFVVSGRDYSHVGGKVLYTDDEDYLIKMAKDALEKLDSVTEALPGKL